MDTVGLLGPNIWYEVKSTFVHVEVPSAAIRRASSAPPKCHCPAVKVQPRALPQMSARRCPVTKPLSSVGSLHTKPLRIDLERELSQCSTKASTIDSNASESEEDGATLRIGNLPNRAKPDRIKQFIDDLGLGDRVDSIYLPLDSRTGVGKGYAFVHFEDEACAAQFALQAEGHRLPRSNSPKEMVVSYASRQAVATMPKHMPKKNANGRTFTAFLWIREGLAQDRASYGWA